MTRVSNDKSDIMTFGEVDRLLDMSSFSCVDCILDVIANRTWCMF